MAAENTDDLFEVLDITGTGGNSLVQRMLGKLSIRPDSSGTQVLVGGVSGWIVGYISKRLGRTAASAVGGGFFLLQAAHQSGYLTINWKKVNRDVRSAQDLVEKKIKQKSDSILPFTRRARSIIKVNAALTISFAGGFFIGLAC